MGYKSYAEQYLDSPGIFKEAVISMLAIVAKARSWASLALIKSKLTKFAG